MVKRRQTRATRTKSKVPATTGYLSAVSSAVQHKPLCGVMYGPSGIGKTSFGAMFPAPLFLIDKQEQGIHDLKSAHLLKEDIPVLPTAETWEQVFGMLAEIADAEHTYKTLVIDSLTGMERLCYTHVCDNEFGGDWSSKGFHSYMQGYSIAQRRYWPLFLDALDNVRQSGVAVLLIAHSEIRRHDDPEREGYDRYEPSIHRKLWDVTHRWAEFVLFANFHVDLEVAGSKKKGKGGHERYMHTENSAAFLAKNRLGLPPVIEMGDTCGEAFTNFAKHLPNPL